jgi:hypothetical protein
VVESLERGDSRPKKPRPNIVDAVGLLVRTNESKLLLCEE